MDDAEIRRAAWRAAVLGINSDHYSKAHARDLRCSAANAPILRDEAAREYEYMQRTLESLDNKAAVALAGSLVLVTYAAASSGNAWARVAVGGLAALAGMFSGTMLAPEKVRGVRVLVMARKYGTVPSARLAVQFGNQYIDAVESLRLPAQVKAIRLRIAMLLLFLSAIAVAWI